MRILLSALIFCFAQLAVAQTTNQSYLGKISKALRGTPPSIEEREQLAQAEASKTADVFLQTKIKEYANTKAFQFKMKSLVDEHFRMKADKNPMNVSAQYMNFSAKSAYDFLVEKVIANNMSWDSFLLEKTYTYEFYKYPQFEQYDKHFYKAILNGQTHYDLVTDIESQEMPDDHQVETVSFDPKDPRIAGVLTTSRFLNRYQNTALNKNRRRAAAVFRSFLCDDMVAAIPAKTNDSEKTDFDTLLPAMPISADGKTEDQLRRELRKSDPHGSLAGCMSCHYKLDPMGKTFALSAGGLSDRPATGALVYKNDDRSVNIPVVGLGDLAQKITQQKEYVDCQVNLFWKWFVGQDVPKTEARQDQLVAQFEKGGRRPLDFISYLVQTPEFKAPPVLLTESQILARKAAKILKRCYDCHKNQDLNDEMKYWDLTDMPYGVSPQASARAVKQIADVLDLPGDGAKKEMPPRDSVWQLSSEEFATLKTWITQGAPDYSGKRQAP